MNSNIQNKRIFSTFGACQQQAFTLVELLITLVIIGVLAAATAPSFINLVKNNRITVVASALTGSVYLARSEALKRKRNIVICASNGTIPVCASSAKWVDGWMVFEDSNSNGVYESTEAVIREQSGIDNPTLGITAPVSLRFNSQGGLSGTSANLAICDDRSGKYGDTIAINIAGQANIKGNQQCN